MINLMYHCVYLADTKESGFQTEASSQYKVSANTFEQQVAWVVNYCKAHNINPNEFVRFTFDDGGISFYSIIAPILEKYGLKGLFFISTAFLNTPGFLTNENVKELSKRGHLIGSHSHTHASLSLLERKEIDKEWNKSIGLLEKICGCRIVFASVPKGYLSKDVIESAQLKGIKYLYTSTPTIAEDSYNDLKVLGRFCVDRNTSLQKYKRIILNSSFRYVLYLKDKILYLAKRVLGNNYNKLKSFIIR